MRKDVKRPINSTIRSKHDEEIIDETRMMQKKLAVIEKSLKTEDDVLEFEREKIKNPDYSSAIATLQTLKDEAQNSNSLKKPSNINNFNNKQGASIIKDFNNDLAYVTKLKKIDREETRVENVRTMHFDYKVEKLLKQANFKQNEIFQNNTSKFHFLTTTKAFESSKGEKFFRNEYLDSTASIFHNKMQNTHKRAQTSYRIKPLHISKRSSDHVKLLLKITDTHMNSCKSNTGVVKMLDTPSSLISYNKDYSVLFSEL